MDLLSLRISVGRRGSDAAAIDVILEDFESASADPERTIADVLAELGRHSMLEGLNLPVDAEVRNGGWQGMLVSLDEKVKDMSCTHATFFVLLEAASAEYSPAATEDGIQVGEGRIADSEASVSVADTKVPHTAKAYDEFNGELQPLAQKRLLKEYAMLERTNLADTGIMHCFDPDQIHKAIAVIVGPEDSPYEGGFYLFEFTFPNSYPVKPPRAVCRTSDGQTRFHPNLYVNGKVCLSILGTWPGPSWSASCTFRTLLLSIQSLLHDHPLRNEPGYEKESGEREEQYCRMVRYSNIATAVTLLRNLSEEFVPLREFMSQTFMSKYERYQRVLDDFKDGETDLCSMYQFSTKYEPSALKEKLKNMYDGFVSGDEQQLEETPTVSQQTGDEKLRLIARATSGAVAAIVAARVVLRLHGMAAWSSSPLFALEDITSRAFYFLTHISILCCGIRACLVIFPTSLDLVYCVLSPFHAYSSRRCNRFVWVYIYAFAYYLTCRFWHRPQFFVEVLLFSDFCVLSRCLAINVVGARARNLPSVARVPENSDIKGFTVVIMLELSTYGGILSQFSALHSWTMLLKMLQLSLFVYRMSMLVRPQPFSIGRVCQPERCSVAVDDNECAIHGCCAICLDNLCTQTEGSSSTILVTRCGHTFHTDCLAVPGSGNLGSRYQRCPTCRALLRAGVYTPDGGVQEAHEESLAEGVNCLFKLVGIYVLYRILNSVTVYILP